jgi:hypothetical protein
MINNNAIITEDNEERFRNLEILVLSLQEELFCLKTEMKQLKNEIGPLKHTWITRVLKKVETD